MLDDLYQELILDHNARPRNFGPLADASHKAEGFNPLCGDHVIVYLQVAGDVIEQVRFSGNGCAISKASASLMTQSLRGKTLAQAEGLFTLFHHMVTGNEQLDADAVVADDALDLGKLEALAGVRTFPMRVKCATLAWHTLQAAVHKQAEPVKTE